MRRLLLNLHYIPIIQDMTVDQKQSRALMDITYEWERQRPSEFTHKYVHQVVVSIKEYKSS